MTNSTHQNKDFNTNVLIEVPFIKKTLHICHLPCWFWKHLSENVLRLIFGLIRARLERVLVQSTGKLNFALMRAT